MLSQDIQQALQGQWPKPISHHRNINQLHLCWVRLAVRLALWWHITLLHLTKTLDPKFTTLKIQILKLITHRRHRPPAAP